MPPAAVQVITMLDQAARGRVDRLQVQLHPQELGTVDIELTFDAEHRVSVSIAVERPETLELLQRESRQIERMLAAQGLELGDGLDLAMQQEHRDPPENGEGQMPNHGSGGGSYANRDDAVTDQADDSVSARTLVARGIYDMTI